MNIHKTKVEVTVLSDGPLPDFTDEAERSWLAWLAEDIDTGTSIGAWTVVSDEVVEPANVERELVLVGNDGTFFSED